MTAHPTPDTPSDASGSRWSRSVDANHPDRQGALSELARSYWYCVYAWWRRAALDAPHAAAATLGCFARWLAESPPSASDFGGARMREWLPARLAELAGREVEWPGTAAIEIDPAWAERRYADEPPGDPDTIFQRRWAITVIEHAEAALLAEYTARGEELLFAELLPFAGFEPTDEARYAAAGARLGRSSGAMHQAVFDFRTRQRELLRAFVADTVLAPAEIESEMSTLLCACDPPGSDGASAPLPTAMQGLRPDELLARAMQTVRMTGAGAGGWEPPTVEEAALLFPQYEVLSLLGRGGMGAVYQARQIELDRLVAIKLLPLEVSVDRDFADRFRREARAMAKLNHPNIIAVFDFGTTHERHLFFVMEYVEGANLHQMIHGPGITPAQALEIIASACDALAYAHGEGVVHRDIKPANVMVSTKGQVKVADFGLARLIDPAAEQLGHTMTGTVMGTPDYMAPEQMRGMNVDHRADIYSLGVMLYEMLCREVPRGIFDPPSARTPGCDTRIDQVVTKAMQQQPERRYQSTPEMKTDVSAASTILSRPPEPTVVSPPPAKPAKSKKPLLIGLAAALAAVALGASFWPKQKDQAAQRPEVKGSDSATESKRSATQATSTVSNATKEAPFVNSLGMKFVPVPILGGPTGGQRMLFSVWDTRVQDYAEFVKETKREWKKPDFEQGPTHPAVMVSWEDAQLFCQWLTARDQAAGRLPTEWRYRLPSDHEWSCAVELGAREDAAKLPAENHEKIKGVFPWGTQWPPPAGAGNYAGEEVRAAQAAGQHQEIKDVIAGYNDGFVETSPVGSFQANRFGLYDLGGNVWQWCEDWFDQAQKDRVLRGASWHFIDRYALQSSHRNHSVPGGRSAYDGFRCVVGVSAPIPAAIPPGPPATSALAEWQDLLPGIRLPDDIRDNATYALDKPGHWELDGGSLRLTSGRGSVVVTPAVVGPDYDVEFKLTRSKGAYAASVGLPVGGQKVIWETLHGDRCGFERIGKTDILTGPASAPDPFVDGKPHHVQLTVRSLAGGQASLRSTIDSQPSAEWTGPASELNVHPSLSHQPKDRLCLGASASTTGAEAEVVFSDVRFRPVARAK
jgi:serine/threonine protein kinase